MKICCIQMNVRASKPEENSARAEHLIRKAAKSKLDVILLMSVNPGFGGQSFIPQTLDKLREVRRRIDESGYDIRLEVDGGVKVNNIGEIAAAGADMFVAGSAIFDQPDYKKVIDEMRGELAKVSHE